MHDNPLNICMHVKRYSSRPLSFKEHPMDRSSVSMVSIIEEINSEVSCIHIMNAVHKLGHVQIQYSFVVETAGYYSL